MISIRNHHQDETSKNYNNTTINEKMEKTSKSILKVLTYNVWFFGGFQKPPSVKKDSSMTKSPSQREMAMLELTRLNTYNFEERMNAIIDEILRHNADVVCLQEMTRWSQEIFTEHKILKSNYDFVFDIQGRYGIAMLTRKGMREGHFQLTKMHSRMGRNLLHCVVSLNSKRVHVATAHFESLSNAKLRREQVKQANDVASSFRKSCVASVLCGDFNFCSYRNFSGDGPLENLVLGEVAPEFVDLWPALMSKKSEASPMSTPDKKTQRDTLGYTFDSETNTNIKKFERMRYDRIMLRSFREVDEVQAESIQMVGTEEIRAIKMHPSDHFGLLALFKTI